MTAAALFVEQLTAGVHDRQILTGVDLEIPFGEVHAIMGPNGSGKSTLCHVLTGKEGFDVSGAASLDGENLLKLTVPDAPALGLLQAFQYPVEVPGVSLGEFLHEVGDARGIDPTMVTLSTGRSGWMSMLLNGARTTSCPAGDSAADLQLRGARAEGGGAR